MTTESNRAASRARKTGLRSSVSVSQWTCFECDEFVEQCWSSRKCREWCKSHAETTGHETCLEEVRSTVFPPP